MRRDTDDEIPMDIVDGIVRHSVFRGPSVSALRQRDSGPVAVLGLRRARVYLTVDTASILYPILLETAPE